MAVVGAGARPAQRSTETVDRPVDKCPKERRTTIRRRDVQDGTEPPATSSERRENASEADEANTTTLAAEIVKRGATMTFSRAPVYFA